MAFYTHLTSNEPNQTNKWMIYCHLHMATLFTLNIIFSIVIIVLYKRMTFIESSCWIITTIIQSIILLSGWYLCHHFRLLQILLQHFNCYKSLTKNTLQRHSTQRYVPTPTMEKECTIYFSKFNINTNIYKLPGNENPFNWKKSIEGISNAKLIENSANLLKRNLSSKFQMFYS